MRRNYLAATAALVLVACSGERSAPDPESALNQDQPASPISNDAEPAAANIAVHKPQARSQFSSINPAKCRLLEQNVEEGGWSRRLCDGPAGYKLELTDSDLRQDITVIPANSQRSELGLTEIVANGAFNALGKTAEWRGVDPADPDALIVRLGVAADPEGRKPDISNLIVARLKPSACIAAVIPPGAGQNERAQAIADGKLPDCPRR